MRPALLRSGCVDGFHGRTDRGVLLALLLRAGVGRAVDVEVGDVLLPLFDIDAGGRNNLILLCPIMRGTIAVIRASVIGIINELVDLASP